MAKRDRRSRALLRNLRKQARKGQLTAREREDLLDQEAKFRKARRANAPYIGAGLAGASALLGTSAGQQLLGNVAGGVQGLRDQALDARLRRQVAKADARTQEEIAELERADAQAKKEEVFDEVRAAAADNPALAATLGIETKPEDGPTTFDDIEKNTDPVVQEEERDPYAEGRAAFESVQPELERLRAEERQRELTSSMNEGRYGGAYIDQLSDIFDAARGGATITVPVYNDAGDVVGTREAHQDETSLSESMLSDLEGASGGGKGYGTLSEEDVQRMMDHARARAEGGDLYVNPINKLGAPLLEGPFVDRTLAGGYPAQMAQREARRAEVMRDVPTDEQLKQERRQQVYDRYLADRAFENELARLRREPVDLTAPQVGPRVSNASGGRTPQTQDLMNKIARKYGIK